MKQNEIEKCAVCSKGVAHSNTISFYRFKIDYMVLNLPAIQRQSGLEMFFGGSGQPGAATLAHVMGGHEDMAKEMSRARGLICMDCAVKTEIAHVMEIISEKEKCSEIPHE